MQLGVGKKYRNRNGDVRGPLKITKSHPDRFTDEMGNWYNANGRYWQQSEWCPFNLIESVDSYQTRLEKLPELLNGAMQITDDMCRRAVEAMVPDRIQGFSTRIECTGSRPTWGAPHYVRDTWKSSGRQLLWSGDSHDEMMERCKIEEMRLALHAALGDSSSPINSTEKI